MFFFWGGGESDCLGRGVRVDVNEELKFFCENSKKKLFWGGRGQEVGGLVGGQCGCERRIEVFVKIKKKLGGRVGGLGWGGQGGCERRIDVLRKFTKKIGGWGSGEGGCSCWGGQGGCERRIEVFEKIHKKNRGGGSGRGGGGCSG